MSTESSRPISAQELQEAIRQRRLPEASRLDRILRLDERRALVEVQGSVTWKSLADRLRPGDAQARELPTTCATVGDSIAWNAAGPDGRPTAAHVESLTMVTPDGQLRRVDRINNPELFALVLGGQGLFGALYSATLRVASLAQAVGEAEPRAQGSTPARTSSLRLLVPPEQADALVVDVHVRCGEWRVPIEAVERRRVRADGETMLRWAQRDYVEVIAGLGELTTIGGAVRITQLRRELIDAAIARGGGFPIACTPEATRAQTDACYPQLAAFLAEQRTVDPRGVMTNPWLRHYRSLLSREDCEVRWGS